MASSNEKDIIAKVTNFTKEDGNFFDVFTSMEDVETFLKWIEPTTTPEGLNVLKHVLGVSEQEGESVEVEGIGPIDVTIASFVKELNGRGLKTLSSCSGLLKEHPTQTERISGYLSFAFQPEARDLVQSICSELELPFEEGKVYFKPSFTVRFKGETDEEIEEKWAVFRARLEDAIKDR